MIQRVAIIGTGLIGASIGLALKATAPHITVLGYDKNPGELETALELHALDQALTTYDTHDGLDPSLADVFVLATPVLPILHWMAHLAPLLGPHQLVTDVGSTKREIADLATELFNGTSETPTPARPRAQFLPGHPMAGKESGGAALADPNLFRAAPWLFTPITSTTQPSEPPSPTPVPSSAIAEQWRSLVTGFGAIPRDLSPTRHDELCAWVSHLPQFLSTALAALLQDHFANDPEGLATLHAIGGRALRETTRLGSSPFSMWRDIALTNTDSIAQTLAALEQRLTHLRENLRTPQLRDEFHTANQFRTKK